MLIWQLILIQVITFVIIIVFLRLLFYRHLSFALKRLQQLHQQNLEKEVSLTKELELAKQERLREIEKGKEEAKKLKESCQEEAERVRQDAVLRAKEEASRILEEANIEKERLKKEARAHIEESAVLLAMEMIRQIFTQKLTETLHLKFVDELIEELRKLEKEQFQIQASKVQVVTSLPLLDSQKNAIGEILLDKMVYPAELEEKVDASIISGLIIDLGSLVMDGSLSNKLRKIIPYLKGER